MKPELMEILVCPACKGHLNLTTTEQDGDTGEILEGTLVCAECEEEYPIRESIPNLLPPELRS